MANELPPKRPIPQKPNIQRPPQKPVINKEAISNTQEKQAVGAQTENQFKQEEIKTQIANQKEEIKADNYEQQEIVANPQDEKEQTKQSINRMFNAATEFCKKNSVNLLILDEICAAITTGMLDENTLISFLENKPTNLEVVMTGRNPSEKLISLADYVTEMKKQKHPFDQCIAAREGIEQ